MNNILLLNGPNLNLLGQREPEIYGHKDLNEIENDLKNIASNYDSTLEAFQSNSESDLVNNIQDKSENTDFIIINPGLIEIVRFLFTSLIMGLIRITHYFEKYLFQICWNCR